VYHSPQAGSSTLRSAPVQGGAVSTHATVDGGPGGILRLDTAAIYWMSRWNTISRVPKAGGPGQTLVALEAGGITDFVVAGGSLVYAEWDGSRIVRIPAIGGQPLVLHAPLADQTRRLASDGTRLYWIDQRDVAWVPLACGEPEFIVLGQVGSSPFQASPMAVEGPRLYWAEADDGAILTATRKQ
jgi:hypothetical protein